MEDTSPQLTVVKSEVPCASLEALPRLPVHVLVVDWDRVDESEGRTLPERLDRLVADLAAESAVFVEGATCGSWSELGQCADGRQDILMLALGAIPASPENPAEPAVRCLGALGQLLREVGARFWVMEPSTQPDDPREQRRREALARKLVANGGPPAVVLPQGWARGDIASFHERLLEASLYDAPLVRAVTRAWDAGLLPEPLVVVPEGGRPGLDLGRLLEDHRQRIDAEGNSLRVFKKEVEAGRRQGRGGADSWEHIEQGIDDVATRIERIRDAYAEINRDRDPPAGSRLSQNIGSLLGLEEAVAGYRDHLVALTQAPGGHR